MKSIKMIFFALCLTLAVTTISITITRRAIAQSPPTCPDNPDVSINNDTEVTVWLVVCDTITWYLEGNEISPSDWEVEAIWGKCDGCANSLPYKIGGAREQWRIWRDVSLPQNYYYITGSSICVPPDFCGWQEDIPSGWQLVDYQGNSVNLNYYLIQKDVELCFYTIPPYNPHLGLQCITFNDPIPTQDPSATLTPEFDCGSVSFEIVTVFQHKDCQGAYVQLLPGFFNLPNINFNDLTSSIHISSGNCATVYEHTDRGGQSRDIQQSYWDLSQDLWANGSGMNDTISSIEVFDNEDCSSSAPPPTTPPPTTSTPESTPPPNPYWWLSEYSAGENPPLKVDFHIRVEQTSDFNAFRLCFDGTNCQENAAPITELYFTWDTYGWSDGFHTISIQYRRQSDGGNWDNALYYEEQFYLSPIRAGIAPCDGGEGLTLTSGSDCLRFTQSRPSLFEISWSDRPNTYAAVSGNYNALIYDSSDYEGSPYLVKSGETVFVGGNVSSIKLIDPPGSYILPTTPYEVDSNSIHLWHFDESGNGVHDSVGGWSGYLYGGNYSWVARDDFGSALKVNGNLDQSTAVTFVPLTFGSTWTFEVWVKFESTSGNERIAGQLTGGGNTGPNKWGLSRAEDRIGATLFHSYGGHLLDSFDSVVPGQWHHIMVTYDDSSRTGKLYLDYVLQETTVLDFPMAAGDTTFQIGGAEGIYACNCTIDEIRLSNVVRTPETSIPPATPTPTPTSTPVASPTPTATPNFSANYSLGWQSITSLPVAKCCGGSAVVGGDMYVVGGIDTQQSKTVHRYDADTNTWSSVASMNVDRYDLAVSAVSGKIYAFGGVQSTYVNTAEVYDPSANSWSYLAPMPTNRAHMDSAVVGEMIYVIGGYNGTHLTTNEMYDPSTNTWSTKASMPTARNENQVVACGGLIYSIGGQLSDGSSTDIVEAYSPTLNAWSIKASLPFALFRSTAVCAQNGRIYLFGSNSDNDVVLEYNPQADTWTQKLDMPHAARRAESAVLENGKILVVGGEGGGTKLTTAYLVTLSQ